MPAKRLTHIDRSGKAVMVDVSGKAATQRIAVAGGSITMQPATLDAILSAGIKKGDVLAAARLAGIMAAKRTHELIPLCHPLALSAVTVDLVPDRKPPALHLTATLKITRPTHTHTETPTPPST